MNGRDDPSRRTTLTILAVAVVAYLVAKVVHEGLGHGVTCLVVGGDLNGVSTSWCDCDKTGLGPWAARAIKAGGTLANFAVGIVAAAWLHRRHGRGTTAYALWLVAAVNLFMGAGYLMVDPIFGFGDWTSFVDGLPSPVVWRVGLVCLGTGIAAATIYALVPFLGAVGDRHAVGRRLALLPWAVVGGGVMTAVAALNVLGLAYAITSAMATVGGTSFLAWFYYLPWSRDVRPLTPVPSTPWLAAGAVALAVAVVLGRGLTFG